MIYLFFMSFVFMAFLDWANSLYYKGGNSEDFGDLPNTYQEGAPEARKTCRSSSTSPVLLSWGCLMLGAAGIPSESPKCQFPQSQGLGWKWHLWKWHLPSLSLWLHCFFSKPQLPCLQGWCSLDSLPWAEPACFPAIIRALHLGAFFQTSVRTRQR